jgi:hypothetical protein
MTAWGMHAIMATKQSSGKFMSQKGFSAMKFAAEIETNTPETVPGPDRGGNTVGRCWRD